MSLPAGRWPTDPITVYSSSVDLAWCRFPKVRRPSEQDSDKKRKCQWKQRCMFLVWPMEREHVLYLTNEDTARSLSDQWRHCTVFIWPMETLHVLYLTIGDTARSLSDQWKHFTFFILPMKTLHVLYLTSWNSTRSPHCRLQVQARTSARRRDFCGILNMNDC